MRFGQDLCIALVLAVVGVGAGKPIVARTEAEGSLAVVEKAMRDSGMTAGQIASIRRLIAQAREREQAGDENGAASAMAHASAILGIG
jgi:hypothetical protein